MKIRSLALIAALACTTLTVAPAVAREAIPYHVEQLPAGAKLPTAIKVKGSHVLQVWTWEEFDDTKRGYAVFSETETARGGRVTGRKIFVQLFTGKGDAQKELRMINDGVTGCEFDVVARFVDGSVSVTDEDADGVNELTFAYDVTCTSDVSPAVRKLLVLEGKDKHALRGTSRVDAGGGDVVGGDYKADPFKKAPALKALAEQRWKDLLGV
jgi:hypothetical protein